MLLNSLFVSEKSCTLHKNIIVWQSILIIVRELLIVFWLKKLEAMGAVLIEGPKACGKTTTAEQQAKSILYG